MIMWLAVSIIGYLFLAIVFILDKIVVSKSKVVPVVYTFYSTIFMLGVFAIFPFVGVGMLWGSDLVWAVVSGTAFGFALWALYKAMEKGEVSHIGPFNAGMVTAFLYFIGFYFLQEKLSVFQIAGAAVLILACLILSSEKSRQHHGFHTGFIWAIISALFFAISHASAKYLYGLHPFWTAFIWTRATTGFVGFLALCFPAVWRTFKRKEKKVESYEHRHAVGIVITDKILGIASVIFLQYAMSIGSPALVQALSGLQFVLMFILIYASTHLWPRIFHEYFTKKELRTELIAIVLVVIGSALIAF